MVFDIQHLADINETHGRAVGDQILQDFAARLERRFSADGDLAYFGGGTFAATFKEQRSHLELTHDSVTPIFGHSLTCGQHPIHVIIQCGLARYAADDHDAEALVRRAEEALETLRGLSSDSLALDTPPADGCSPHS